MSYLRAACELPVSAALLWSLQAACESRSAEVAAGRTSEVCCCEPPVCYLRTVCKPPASAALLWLPESACEAVLLGLLRAALLWSAAASRSAEVCCREPPAESAEELPCGVKLQPSC